MSADVCVCGHLDVPSHKDAVGPCRAYCCGCEVFQSEDDAVVEIEDAA